jgi:hypothetical protein
MVIECWEQFCHAREEVREEETVFSRLESSIAVDGFYGKKERRQ